MMEQEEEDQTEEFVRSIHKLWKSRAFNIFIDICRILSLIIIIALAIYMIKNIEAVKFLAYDPCKLCMAKTGCACYCFNL